MPLMQDDFNKGQQRDAPPYKSPVGTVRVARNMVIDESGELLALCWMNTAGQVEVGTQTSPNVTEPPQLDLSHDPVDDGRQTPLYRSDLTVDPGGTFKKSARRGYSRISGPGDFKTGALAANNVLGVTQAMVNTDGANWVGEGCSNFVEAFNEPVGQSDQYCAMWGASNNGGPTPRDSFYIHRLRDIAGVVTPALHSLSEIRYNPNVATGVSSPTDGAKFPQFVEIFSGQMWVAGDADDDDVKMSNVVMASGLPLTSGGFDFATVGLPPADGWESYRRSVPDNAITGLKALDEALFIFGTRYIVRHQGIFNDFVSDRIMEGRGCIASGSISKYDAAFIYLSEDGFIMMASDGSFQNLSVMAGFEEDTKSMIQAQSRAQSGRFAGAGGSSCVQEDRYWYVWPTGDIWCYDIRNQAWSLFNSTYPIERKFTGITDFSRRLTPSLVSPGEGKWPSFLFRNSGADYIVANLSESPEHTEPIQISLGKENPTGWFQPFFVETQQYFEDREEKRLRAIVIDFILRTPGPLTATSVTATIGVQVTNERDETVYRGQFAANEPGIGDPGAIVDESYRAVLQLDNQQMSGLYTIQLFSTSGGMNTACLQPGFEIGPDYTGDSTGYFKLEAVRLYADRESIPAFTDDDRLIATRLVGSEMAEFNIQPSDPAADPRGDIQSWSIDNQAGALMTTFAATPSGYLFGKDQGVGGVQTAWAVIDRSLPENADTWEFTVIAQDAPAPYDLSSIGMVLCSDPTVIPTLSSPASPGVSAINDPSVVLALTIEKNASANPFFDARLYVSSGGDYTYNASRLEPLELSLIPVSIRVRRLGSFGEFSVESKRSTDERWSEQLRMTASSKAQASRLYPAFYIEHDGDEVGISDIKVYRDDEVVS